MQRVKMTSIPGKGAALCFAWLLISLSHANAAENVDDCDDCHGENGVSSEGDVPTIAGASAFVLEEYMFQFQEEARPCRNSSYRKGDLDRPEIDMCTVAKALSEAEILELAEHYANQEYVAAEQDFDAALAAEGRKVHRRACEKCHTDGGSLAEDDAGMLAGQWIPYLEQVFADFESGERGMMEDKMQEKIDALDADSVNALIHYYASLQ